MSATDPKTCTHGDCPKTFDRDPALDVACPTCDAAPGDLCRRPSGHAVWNSEWPGLPNGIHPDRDREALRHGVYGTCPLGECPESVDELSEGTPRSSGASTTGPTANDGTSARDTDERKQAALDTF